MMELIAIREIFTDKSTVSPLSIGDVPECYILEDVVRSPGVKVYGATAIPYGRYKVSMAWSNHYQRLMPHLEAVPNFTDIMIHWGNKPEDTKGCILVGTYNPLNPDWISNSQIVWKTLMIKIQPAIERGECWFDIRKAA